MARSDGRRDADAMVSYPCQGYLIREAETGEGEPRLWYVSALEADTIEAGPFESPGACEEWIHR